VVVFPLSFLALLSFPWVVFVLPADMAHARFPLFDDSTGGDDDLDLYVFL
jgi:hypothetical protein